MTEGGAGRAKRWAVCARENSQGFYFFDGDSGWHEEDDANLKATEPVVVTVGTFGPDPWGCP